MSELITVDEAFGAIRGELDRLKAENERIGEYLSTLYVNALRTTPKTRAQFVSFIVYFLSDVRSSGRPVSEAVKAFDAGQKCGECGAFSPVLGNNKCQECTPEGEFCCSQVSS
jgi:hypothetical protein